VINVTENNDGKKFVGSESVKEEKNKKVLEDPKINVKIKLSVLWITLVFFYLYNDVISLFRKDILEEALTGEMAGMHISQTFLLAAAVLMSVSILMTFLSLALPAKVNRPTNIIVGIFHAVVLAATMTVPGETWAHYALYMVFEAVFIALIVGYAWKWPVQVSVSAPSSEMKSAEYSVT
jgi:hypothetical protein